MGKDGKRSVQAEKLLNTKKNVRKKLYKIKEIVKINTYSIVYYKVKYSLTVFHPEKIKFHKKPKN